MGLSKLRAKPIPRWFAPSFAAVIVLLAFAGRAPAQSRGITGRGGFAGAGVGGNGAGGFGLRGGVGAGSFGRHAGFGGSGFGRLGSGQRFGQVCALPQRQGTARGSLWGLHGSSRRGLTVRTGFSGHRGPAGRQGFAGGCGDQSRFGLTRPFGQGSGSLGLTRPHFDRRATTCDRGPSRVGLLCEEHRHHPDKCLPRGGHGGYRPCFVAPYFVGYGYATTVVVEEPYTDYVDAYGAIEPADPSAAESAAGDDAPAGLLHFGAILMKRGEYEAAADVLLEAVLVDPEAVLPRMLFVHALFANGEYEYAAYVLQTALEPSEDAGVYKLGVLDLYADRREFDRLLERLAEYVKHHPFEYEPHLLFGYFRYFAGEFDAAIRSLNEALRIRFEDASAKTLRDWARGAAQMEKKPRVIQPKSVYPPGGGPGAEPAESCRE